MDALLSLLGIGGCVYLVLRGVAAFASAMDAPSMDQARLDAEYLRLLLERSQPIGTWSVKAPAAVCRKCGGPVLKPIDGGKGKAS